MEIILQEKIQNLGNLGDKVNVKSGFARNYLIPKGFAVPATKTNLIAFESRRAELEKLAASKLAKAKNRESKVAELGKVVISSRSGDEGKLFGSIGTADIANSIIAAGLDVDKKEVLLPEGPLRRIGEYDITLHFHPDVNAVIMVSVITE